MLIDLTLEVTPRMTRDAKGSLNAALAGHLGTHFDVMNQVFPLEYTERKAVVFDVAHIRDRDIEPSDIDLNRVEAEMFVAFRTGFIEEEEYGTQRYFKEHPQLSKALLDALLHRRVSIIGVDCCGVRRGSEHTPMDQRCADQGVFVVENLCRLKEVLNAGGEFSARTYPMNFSGLTGLPCRVVAEISNS